MTPVMLSIGFTVGFMLGNMAQWRYYCWVDKNYPKIAKMMFIIALKSRGHSIDSYVRAVEEKFNESIQTRPSDSST